MQVQRFRRRDEPSWWLGWAAVALEVAAVVFLIAWVRIDSSNPVFGWWGLWVVCVVGYLGGGVAGAVAVILGTSATARGGGWKLGLGAVLFVIVTLCLSVVVLPGLLGGGG